MNEDEEYKVCECGNRKFYVIKVQQVNGNDDTFEFICTECGEEVELYGNGY